MSRYPIDRLSWAYTDTDQKIERATNAETVDLMSDSKTKIPETNSSLGEAKPLQNRRMRLELSNLFMAL